jgi:pimeloyl-ACP methyl ester carboxylesterase
MKPDLALVDVGQVRLHTAMYGDGPPVVLLHGFPEYWYSWRHQMRALAAAGYRAIAPDMRGYHLSDKPRGVSQYRVEQLAADVVGLIRALNYDKVHLVAHDWGGVVAFYVAGLYPERVEKLVIMNAPHPAIFRRAMRTRAQRARSRYVLMFQVPFIPEWTVRRKHFMQRLLRGWAVHNGAFTDLDIARFEEALAMPGAATAAIHYYRAALRYRAPSLPVIHAPALVIWGEQDRALGAELLEGLDHYVPRVRIHRLPDASHWVQQDCPEETNAALIGFLGRS